MINIDTHKQTNKQTNTQGENIITSLSRVIIITDSKERWMYVMDYKPPDIKTSLFVNTLA